MTANDIREDVRKQRFQPLRVIVDDGSQYDIHHPELCMVGVGSVIVGLASDPTSPYFERTVRISIDHISRVVPLPISPATTNGPGGPKPD